MKKIIQLMMVFVLVAAVSVPSTMAAKDPVKKAKKEIKKKAIKEARKEARRLKRKDWYVSPGALPLPKQVEKSWQRQYLEDENGYPQYIVATGNSVAESQSAAKLQATELAKLELAGLVQSNIAALIENSVANNQLSREEAASVTKTVAASKNIIAQEIGRVIVMFEIYREVGDANIESSVRVGYDTRLAHEAGIKAIKKNLEDDTERLHQKLDKLLDF